jgi:ribonuclease P protein component
VFQDGRRLADQLFTVFYRANEHGDARIGLAISKKRIARAVRRNRIRRLIRESFRYNRPTLGCLDIVVMAQARADAATRQELGESLDRHWDRLRKTVDRNGDMAGQ